MGNPLKKTGFGKAIWAVGDAAKSVASKTKIGQVAMGILDASPADTTPTGKKGEVPVTKTRKYTNRFILILVVLYIVAHLLGIDLSPIIDSIF